MLTDVKDKIIWITGAGSGIGQAAAIALSAQGATVIVSGRRKDRLEALAAELTGTIRIEPLDIADQQAVSAVAKRIISEFTKIDILVNSAGLNIVGRSWQDINVENWDEVINVNLNGAFYCAQSVLPAMREQADGLIINISSWAGKHVSRLTGAAYTASKHALNAMTESINQENCQFGIRACAICPGEVATEILDRRPVPVSLEDRAKMVQAEDVGDLILHVCCTPAHVCLNEITISPTWNRGYIGR
jgi:NADP-dependent 3-hydroxy acid dehydrogenase YdfG